MLAARTHESKDDLSAYEQICLAAKNKDEKLLLEALATVSIDVFNPENLDFPITKLALDNDEEAVKFLVKHGSSEVYAAYGHAIEGRGEAKEAQALLTKYENENNPLFLSMLYRVMEGLARGKHLEILNEFYQKIKIKYPDQCDHIIEYIVFGFGKGGHDDEIYKWLDLAKIEYPYYFFRILQNAIDGLTRRGHSPAVDKFLEKMKVEYSDKILEILDYAVYGYTIGGREEDANKFLDILKKEHAPHMLQFLKSRAMGLGRTGNHLKAYEFLEEINKIAPNEIECTSKNIILNLAMAGFDNQVFKLLNAIKIQSKDLYLEALKFAAIGFIRRSNIRDFELFLKQVQNENIIILNLVLEYLAIELPKSNSISELCILVDVVKRIYPDQSCKIFYKIAFELAQKKEAIPILTFIRQIKNLYPDYQLKFTVWFAQYFGRQGNLIKINSFLDIIKNENYLNYPLILERITLGLADRGFYEKALNFIYKIKNEENITFLLHNLGWGLASGGYYRKVNDFLFMVKREYPLKLNLVLMHVAVGFVQGNHFSLANDFYQAAKLKYHNSDSIQILSSIAKEYGLKELTEEAYKFIEEVKTDHPTHLSHALENLAEGLAVASKTGSKVKWYNFFIKVNKEFPQHLSNVMGTMARKLAENGQINQIYKLLNKPRLLRADMKPILAKIFSTSEDHVYRLLDMVENDYPEHFFHAFRQIAFWAWLTNKPIPKDLVRRATATVSTVEGRLAELKTIELYTKEYDPFTLVESAGKYNELMQKQKINYKQASCWVSQEAQFFFIQWSRLLPKDISSYIATFLYPITDRQANDLCMKMKRAYMPRLFGKALEATQSEAKEEKAHLPDVPLPDSTRCHCVIL